MRPRCTLAPLALAGALFAGRPAAATLLLYEPFDYAPGTVLDAVPATGQNLTGNWLPLGPIVPQKLFVDDAGLDYGNLVGVPAAAGNRPTQPSGTTSGGASASIDQDIQIGPGEAIFFSALFRFDDTPNGNRFASLSLIDDATGDLISFGQTVVGVRAIRVAASLADEDDEISAGVDGAFADDQTLLLVGRYSNSAAALGDTLELIGYDTADADVLPASFDPADPNAEFSFRVDDVDIGLSTISSIHVRIRGDDNNFADELRIGTTYASLVAAPEPAAAALLALASAGLGFRARRRPAPA